mmetsp:Transcript_609/g.739  ORF Transcript_609/g.739 Transcript_609/m.739 type:complete len:372 (+) Transcript_609:60-1175(+)
MEDSTPTASSIDLTEEEIVGDTPKPITKPVITLEVLRNVVSYQQGEIRALKEQVKKLAAKVADSKPREQEDRPVRDHLRPRRRRGRGEPSGLMSKAFGLLVVIVAAILFHKITTVHEVLVRNVAMEHRKRAITQATAPVMHPTTRGRKYHEAEPITEFVYKGWSGALWTVSLTQENGSIRMFHRPVEGLGRGHDDNRIQFLNEQGRRVQVTLAGSKYYLQLTEEQPYNTWNGWKNFKSSIMSFTSEGGKTIHLHYYKGAFYKVNPIDHFAYKTWQGSIKTFTGINKRIGVFVDNSFALGVHSVSAEYIAWNGKKWSVYLDKIGSDTFYHVINGNAQQTYRSNNIQYLGSNGTKCVCQSLQKDDLSCFCRAQ